MYIQSRPVTLQSPLVVVNGFNALVPLVKQDCLCKAGGNKGTIVAAGTRWKTEKGTESLEGLIIPTTNCLVTVIVQKY